MTARRVNLLWLVSGLALIVLVVATGWFTVIRPKQADIKAAEEATADTTIQINQLQRRLADLAVESKQLGTYTKQLERYQAALPSVPAVPAFLTALQSSGAQVDVRVSGLTVAGPEESKTMPSVWELPISLTAEGSAANLSRFLIQLQNVQSRAVLIKSANLTPGGDSMSLAVTLAAFVVPPAGAGTPTVTTQ